jgi:proline dehydrogenase
MYALKFASAPGVGMAVARGRRLAPAVARPTFSTATLRVPSQPERHSATSSSASAGDIGKDAGKLNFQDAQVAFDSKGTLELFRTVGIFKVCSIGLIVRHCEMLYSLSARILGKTLTHGVMRHTFFNHFCAGESASEIIPRMEYLRKHGIGGILDYAAEAKDDEAPKSEMADTACDATIGAPLSSRKYDYQGEAQCDKNAAIFLDAVRAVKDATPDGFAAIKLSGLGNPVLLQRMSTLLVELVVFFKNLSVDEVVIRRGMRIADIIRGTPYHAIDRAFKLDFEHFSNGWKRAFFVETDEELRKSFDEIDVDKDGFIDYIDWSSSVRLSEINALCRGCKEEGPLFRAALDEEEVELYHNMCDRVQKIMDLAQELGVRVMVDAEWMDIQPAIDHLVLFLQRKYNHGDQPIVFNTYQNYLKGMENKVLRDLERSRREGWRFGAKMVRGAYMVSERRKALERGLESPICETYEDTEAEFHASIDAVLAHTELEQAAPLQPGCIDGPGRTAGAEVLVASHNRESIERTLQKIKEFGTNREHVYFGQLMGMADHVTFTLGAHGYKAYKYVPYGPIGEVMPYLIRRTQENSAILGSPGVQEERTMVSSELKRRLNPLRC